MKTLSVIIPYKVDRGWLKEAIYSVEQQETQHDIQLILAKGNGNWPTNFNAGLKEAKGEYIKYLHEDDMLMQHAAERIIHHFEVSECDFLHGKAVEFWQGLNNTRVYTPSMKYPLFHDLLDRNVIHSVTTAYKREVFEKVGYMSEDDRMYSFEEYEFHLRLLQAGCEISYIDEVIGQYRRHPKQIIRTVDAISRSVNREEMLNKFRK